eukprot:705647-Pleurochrysis_carterae.AAC.2
MQACPQTDLSCRTHSATARCTNIANKNNLARTERQQSMHAREHACAFAHRLWSSNLVQRACG